MKTNRKAYVVVVRSAVTKSITDVAVFTNRYAASMCLRQFAPERHNGIGSLHVRFMNDGRTKPMW